MIDLYKHQDEFLYSEESHTGLVAGYGAGKTFIGTLKTLSKKMMYPGVDVAYYLPTYSLIKDIAIPSFRERLEAQKVPYEINISDKNIKTPFGRIILRSTDNPDLIIGYEVGYSLIDEADIPPTDKMKDVFTKALGRNRAKLPNGDINQLDFVSTPEGFKFMYHFFIKNASDRKRLIRAKTQDNKTISESYIESLKENYTEAQLKAYLNGEFVNLTSGSVYTNYDRAENHTDRTVQKNDTLHVGMDFNITNMNAVINVIEGKMRYAVDEVVGAYDTSDVVRILKHRYPDHSIVVYPDASGQNRSTSGTTDLKILKDARFTVKSPKKNPLVRDRVNSLNLALKNNKGERTLLINSNTCPALSQALENQTYKNGVPDKEGGFDHINEAQGYFIFGSNRTKKTVRIRA